jgi:plastocyanin
MKMNICNKFIAGLTIILILALFLLPTCTSTSTSPAPTLKIIAPTATLYAPGNVNVTVQVENFKIVDKQGQSNVSGEGHLHYYLDVDAPTTPGQPAIPPSGIWAHIASTSYSFTNITSGTHKISVELVNNDHTPLSPPVVATMSVLIIPEIGPPNVVIATPIAGENVSTGDVTVSVQVTNFNVVDKQGQANVSHEGHIHYYLDVEAPTTAGQPAIPVSGVWAHVATTSYTFTNVSPGSHFVDVELINNDHTPLSPPVVSRVTFNVIGSTSAVPTLVILSPTDGASLSAGDISINVQTSNFNVVDKQGQANVVGEGHLHYYLDIDAPTAPGQPAIPPSGVWAHVAATNYIFTGVPAGNHFVSVELINNDHTPLNPPIVAKVNFTVAAQSIAPVTIELNAQNLAFNTNTITVKAGSSVTINFNNMDSGIQHNFALFNDSNAAPPAIFQGQLITGPATATYTFTAPTKVGTYFFRCDVHPTMMTGSFIVQ